MGWILFIAALLFFLGWSLLRYLDGDPMNSLLDELAARDLLSKLLAVPRYEFIVREILNEKDGNR